MSSRAGCGAAYLGEGRNHHGRRRFRRVSRRRSAASSYRTFRSATTRSCTSVSPCSGSTSGRPRRRWPTSSGWASWTWSSATRGPERPRKLGKRCRSEVHRRVQRSGAGQAAAGRHPRDRDPALGADGGLRRADAFDHPARDRPADPRADRDDPRPRLPGVRDAAGADRQGAGDRLPAGRDLLLLRGHAAGAGQRPGPVPDQEPGRRRPGRLLAARRLEAGPGEPGPAGGLLRHRLRDHRAAQRDDGVPGQADGRGRTSPCWSPTCGCRRPSRRS